MNKKALLELSAWLFSLVQHNPLELSEALLTCSDAVRVLEEGLMGYMKQLKEQIEASTDPKLLEPSVTATCSIEGHELKAVNVTLGLAHASDQDLQCLREEDFSRGPTAKTLIKFMMFFNSDVEALFGVPDPEVICQINQEEAETWIATHLHHLNNK